MNELKITDIRVWPLRNPKPGTKLKANCRITFNECLSINGKLWDGRNGLFVGADGKYGDKKTQEGNTEQIFYPSWLIKDREHQQELSQAVVQEYNKITNNTSSNVGNSFNNQNSNNTNQNQNQNQSQNSFSKNQGFDDSNVPF